MDRFVDLKIVGAVDSPVRPSDVLQVNARPVLEPELNLAQLKSP